MKKLKKVAHELYLAAADIYAHQDDMPHTFESRMRRLDRLADALDAYEALLDE